jgi:hypothetical protein
MLARLSNQEIIRRLVLTSGERKGTVRLSALKVLARGLRLKDSADEDHIAACVCAVLATYGYEAARSEEPYVSESAVLEALGQHNRNCECSECTGIVHEDGCDCFTCT